MEIYILVFLLVYNNSLVLLGPTTWGAGIKPKKSLAIATLGQISGVVTSNMTPLVLNFDEFLYIVTLYVFLSLAKISLPISIITYAMSIQRSEAVALWMLSPLFAVLTPAFCRLKNNALAMPTLFAVMYMFGYNNIALLSHDLFLTTVATFLGTYFGLKYSRWVIDLTALKPATAISINLTIISGAVVGSIYKIPISFTLVAYSALLSASMQYVVKFVRFEKFVKAYLGILLTIVLVVIFPYLKSLLQYLALPIA